MGSGNRTMKIEEVTIEPGEGRQLIVGQAHFIKTVEDLYESLTTSMPGIRFGVAFCEASGKKLVRAEGSDPASTKVATEWALKIGAGHSFVVILEGAFPINVLNRLKGIEEVATIFCATSNVTSVIVADNGAGRGILGVIDGGSPVGIENSADAVERKQFLRKIGYKK